MLILYSFNKKRERCWLMKVVSRLESKKVVSKIADGDVNSKNKGGSLLCEHHWMDHKTCTYPGEAVDAPEKSRSQEFSCLDIFGWYMLVFWFMSWDGRISIFQTNIQRPQVELSDQEKNPDTNITWKRVDSWCEHRPQDLSTLTLPDKYRYDNHEISIIVT